MLVVVAVVAGLEPWPVVNLCRAAGDLAATRAVFERQHPVPVQVVSMLGGWLRLQHAGWLLLEAVPREYRQADVGMI